MLKIYLNLSNNQRFSDLTTRSYHSKYLFSNVLDNILKIRDENEEPLVVVSGDEPLLNDISMLERMVDTFKYYNINFTTISNLLSNITYDKIKLLREFSKNEKHPIYCRMNFSSRYDVIEQFQTMKYLSENFKICSVPFIELNKRVVSLDPQSFINSFSLFKTIYFSFPDQNLPDNVILSEWLKQIYSNFKIHNKGKETFEKLNIRFFKNLKECKNHKHTNSLLKIFNIDQKSNIEDKTNHSKDDFFRIYENVPNNLNLKFL